MGIRNSIRNSDKKTKWGLIGTFISSHKGWVITTLVIGFLFNILTVLLPISIGKFYEFAFGFSSHRLKAFGFIPYMDAKGHTNFFFLFFGLVGLRFLFEYFNRFSISLLGEGLSKSLREDLFNAQLQIAQPVYDKKGIGRYLLRFSGDLKSIQIFLRNGVLRFIQDIMLLVTVFGVIAYMDLRLSGIILGFVVIAMIPLWLLNNLLYRQSLERRNRRSGMLSFVNTRLRAIASVKAFNRYTPENKRYRRRSEKLYAIGRKYVRTVAFLQSGVPALAYTLLGVIMLYILNGPQADSADGGSLLVIILLILAILPVLRRTLKVSLVWRMGEISLQKLIHIFEMPQENGLPLEKISFKDSIIKFENVEFRYEESKKPVLEKLNLEILPRKTTLIYGPSGSGKSTMIKLLLKTDSPKKGTLNVNGVPYASLSEKSIRKNIAVVSKDYPIYGRDVYEALVYARNPERKKKAEALLEYLQQYEKPKNRLYLQDVIGELGCNLNSGQIKLLMYCRALLTNKPVLIVEEPFEYLSSKTAQLIAQMLNEIKKEKSLILFSQSKQQFLDLDNTLFLHTEPKVPLHV